jgi:uracil-DNA glycosylase family 4
VTSEERRASLEAIAAEVEVCTKCRLAAGRTRAVPGEGHPDTEVVFVGEGPGQNEDQQGRPFVGAAGGLLTELLGSVGWKREEVFITNVVKCRPPGNRDPEPDEIAACAPYLRRQLEVLDPALVVTLGRFSLQTFMPGARIGQVHGTVRPVDPETGARNAMAFAMYHPAAAFRQGSLKETMQLDMCSIPDAVLRARAAREGASGAEVVPSPERATSPEQPTSPERPTSPEPATAAAAAGPAITIDVAPAIEMSVQISVVQELVVTLPEAQSDASEQGLWG